MTSNLIFVIPAILFFVLSNIIMYHLVMHKARTRIKEYFESLGLTLVSLRKIGWFDRGNFNNEIYEGGGYRKSGSFKSTHYWNIDFKDSSGKVRTSTVKIKWNLFKRTQLEFRPDVKKYLAHQSAYIIPK